MTENIKFSGRFESPPFNFRLDVKPDITPQECVDLFLLILAMFVGATDMSKLGDVLMTLPYDEYQKIPESVRRHLT